MSYFPSTTLNEMHPPSSPPPQHKATSATADRKKWLTIALVVALVAAIIIATSGIALFCFLGGFAALSFAGLSVASLTLPNICVGAAALATFAAITTAIVAKAKYTPSKTSKVEDIPEETTKLPNRKLRRPTEQVKLNQEKACRALLDKKEAMKAWAEEQKTAYMKAYTSLHGVSGVSSFDAILDSIQANMDPDFVTTHTQFITAMNAYADKDTLQEALNDVVSAHNCVHNARQSKAKL